MIKYSSYTIDYQSLKNGVSQFEFPITKELFELYQESEIDNGKGMVKLTVNKNGNVAQMHTEIDAFVTMPCDRCLDFVDIKVDWQGDCLIKVSDQQGEYDGEIIWVGTRQNMVDLIQYFYESIVLGLPICRVHKSIENCNKEVVKYLNIES